MVSNSSLKTLSKAALQLYAPDLNSANWTEHAFQFLLTIVSADMVNYGSLDASSGQLDASTTCESLQWNEAVTGFGRFMKKYPFFNFDPTVNEGRPFFRNDFVSARQFRDLDIYSECFRILETTDHAAVHVPTNDGRIAWFGLERGGNRDFNECDRLLLTLAQDHLVNSRKLAIARIDGRDELPREPSIFGQAGLRPREAEIAYWLTEGKTNAEIAILMKIQIQTVKGYLTALFDRFGTGNRLSLTLHLLELARRLSSGATATHSFPVQSWEDSSCL